MLTGPNHCREKNIKALIASPLLGYKNQQHPGIAALGGNFLMEGGLGREEMFVGGYYSTHDNQRHQV